MQSPPGFVIARGVSPIDGAPFVAALTLKSRNRKTGRMLQVWIIRPDQHPIDALASGADRTICGDCPHRPRFDPEAERIVRSCYVNLRTVAAVWRAYCRGSYPDWHPDYSRFLRGRRIRWGAYGDPAILSPEVVRNLTALADGHTGYTHQWREPWAAWSRGFFQASCDGLTDYLDASAAGWRTFAVVPRDSAPYSGKLCPATAPDSQAQCLTCRLCDGARQDIWVEAHGVGAAHVPTSLIPEPVAA